MRSCLQQHSVSAANAVLDGPAPMEAEAAPAAADAAAEAAQPEVVMQKKTRTRRTNLPVDVTDMLGWSLQQQNEFFEKEVRRDGL